MTRSTGGCGRKKMGARVHWKRTFSCVLDLDASPQDRTLIQTSNIIFALIFDSASHGYNFRQILIRAISRHSYLILHAKKTKSKPHKYAPGFTHASLGGSWYGLIPFNWKFMCFSATFMPKLVGEQLRHCWKEERGGARGKTVPSHNF